MSMVEPSLPVKVHAAAAKDPRPVPRPDPQPAMKRRGWMPWFWAAALLLVLIGISMCPGVREQIVAHLTTGRGHAVATRLVRLYLAGRYRFYEVEPAMVWNNRAPIDHEHKTVDFLSSIVVSTDSPTILLFANFLHSGPKSLPAFDISIDGGPAKTVVWRSALLPERLDLGAAGEHTVLIHANLLLYHDIGVPFPLRQQAITGFSVPARYRIKAKLEPPQRRTLVTVTDSIGQGYKTADPAHDAWTARLAESGRWPGAVMNRGFVGAQLPDLCGNRVSCNAFAARLDQDYPNAAAYYFALGTNDFGLGPGCIPSGLFERELASLLDELHTRNPQAALYVQTPAHRADEALRNQCGDTLEEFRDDEIQMARSRTWISLVDGFSAAFPQNAQGSSAFVDGIHLTAEGQEQYFHAVMQRLHIGA